MANLHSLIECPQKYERPRHYLIGQFGSFGDCLYATTLARQLKADEPTCYVTWAIGSLYRSILDGNPYVDAIWEIQISKRTDMLSCWGMFSVEAQRRKENGEFDAIFLTQIFPANLSNFDGTLRTSIFRALKRPITVSVEPVVVLSLEEVADVQAFALQHNLNSFREVILFESSPLSGQSFVDRSFAEKVAALLVGEGREDICVIMSANDTVSNSNPRIIDGSELTFRQNAELTKYCTLFVGCSSGISWLCTSEWAKRLPMLILLSKDTNVYASMIHDHEHFNLPSDHIIEMTDCDVEQVVACVSEIITHGITRARLHYYRRIEPTFCHYLGTVLYSVLSGMSSRDALKSLKYTAHRYGYFQLFTGIVGFVVKKSIKLTKRLIGM